jgi:phosphotransferase system enzyme I (PtsI)
MPWSGWWSAISMSSPAPELRFAGTAASAGLAVGPIALQIEQGPVEESKGTPAEERARLAEALTAAGASLRRLMSESGEEAAEILEFQLALLEDPELTAPVKAAIDAGHGATAAWRAALAGQIADYEAAEDEYFRARALDLADLEDRVRRALSGPVVTTSSAVPEGAIYVAQGLTPSRFLETDWRRYGGAVLMSGSAASHVSILARARGVPLVVALDAAAGELADGAAAVLDAEAGQLITAPTEKTLIHYRRRIAKRREADAAAARYLPQPAKTASGEVVKVSINVDHPGILQGIDPGHCDGIGLTRTEFLFEGGGDLPGEEAQLAAYQGLIAWAAGREVTVRTLDAGGDKPIPGVTPEGEENPFLGLRGLRLSLARRELFRVQLRALCRAAAAGPLKVMFPMVTRPWEFAEARALTLEVLPELRAAGLAAELPALGIMVEVPAAALDIAAFDADFYSIGSNDLIQYVTAASRDNPAVAPLYDPLDPGVLELIGRVVAHGRASGREVGLCGDMAGDLETLPALLDAGLRSLSVAPAALAPIKAGIARHD